MARVVERHVQFACIGRPDTVLSIDLHMEALVPVLPDHDVLEAAGLPSVTDAANHFGGSAGQQDDARRMNQLNQQVLPPAGTYL